MIQMNNVRDKKPWFSIRRQMAVFMVILLLMAVISAVELKKAREVLDDVDNIWDDYHICETESSNLRNASDLLTNAVRNFTLSFRTEDMDRYWIEIEENRTRDNAVKTLTEMDLTGEEEALVQAAKAESDNLMKVEIHAMRLIAENLELPEDELPSEVRK